MQFRDAPRLLEPSTLPYLSGIERLDDGLLHVACLTRMPGVSPAMIAWWFTDHLQTTAQYQRWHPRDHLWMAWEDKRQGEIVGAKHCVHEFVGGKLQKLKITFLPPEDYLGDALAQVPGAFAVCARPGELEKPIDIGRMIHLALPTPWGCELHSRFWLGYVHSRRGDGWINYWGNRPWLRRRLASDTVGRALLVHCHEEMTTLSSFLPALYTQQQSNPEPA